MLPIVWKLAPYAAVVFLALGAYQFAPLVGVNAQRHRLETARDQYKTESAAWHRNADGWRASFGKSEGLRRSENLTAVAAVNATQAQCGLRVAEARRSAQAIKRIINAPVKLDADHCPVRAVIGADVLRDALGSPGR